MGATFAKVLPLALGAAISPVILLLQVATLASPRYPVRRACIVLGATALVVATVMLAVAATDHAASTAPKTDPVVGGWIRVVLAVVLLAGAVRAALSPAPEEQHPPEGADAADAPVHGWRYFLLGIVAMVTNITTIVLLIPATRDAASADLASGQRLLILAVVFLITLFPAYGPLLALAALGSRGPAALAAMSAWLHRHHKAVTVAVSLGFSVYLGISGWIALA